MPRWLESRSVYHINRYSGRRGGGEGRERGRGEVFRLVGSVEPAAISWAASTVAHGRPWIRDPGGNRPRSSRSHESRAVIHVGLRRDPYTGTRKSTCLEKFSLSKNLVPSSSSTSRYLLRSIFRFRTLHELLQIVDFPWARLVDNGKKNIRKFPESINYQLSREYRLAILDLWTR